MTEIFLDYTELQNAIDTLNRLEKGTGYTTSTILINQGKGSMYENTNLLYQKLCNTEEQLIQIIHSTKDALIKAGINFESAENTMRNYYQRWVQQHEE